MVSSDTKPQFVLWILNTDCDDLEKGMVYRVCPDLAARAEGYLRIVDASGEDYLYPESYFVLIDLPEEAKEALMMA